MVLWPEAFTAKRQANGYRLKSILKSVARAREQGWYGVNCHQRSGIAEGRSWAGALGAFGNAVLGGVVLRIQVNRLHG